MLATSPQLNNEHSLPGDVPVDQLAHTHPRKTNARSSNSGRRKDEPLNSQGALVVKEKGKPEHEQKKQKYASLPERLRNCVPNDPNAFLFTLVITAYLICAVIDFIHTGNASMLERLLPYVSAYVGVSRVVPLLPWSKKENN